MMVAKDDIAPSRFLARGLSRHEAAAYIGVSTTLFDKMVGDGRMPGPKELNSRVVWDRLALDAAFASLPDRNSVEPGAPEGSIWDNPVA